MHPQPEVPTWNGVCLYFKILHNFDTPQELWHQEVIAFGASQKLTVLSPYIPFKAPQLEGWVYELVLSAFLKVQL